MPTIAVVVLVVRIHQLAELPRVAHLHHDRLAKKVFNDRVSHITGFDAHLSVGLKSVGQILVPSRCVGNEKVISFVTVLSKRCNVEVAFVGVNADVSGHWWSRPGARPGLTRPRATMIAETPLYPPRPFDTS